MTFKKLKKNEFNAATAGLLSFFEKIIRSHPLMYIFIRSIVRFTNIFEKDFDGLKILKLEKIINFFDKNPKYKKLASKYTLDGYKTMYL